MLDPSVKSVRALYPQYQGPVLVVLDFLQLVASDPDHGREDLRERVSRAAYQARAIAREQDAIVIVLSSTARDNYEKTRVEPVKTKSAYPESASGLELKRPHLSDLVGLGKESGDVEYAADSVLVFCPEHYPNEPPDRSVRSARRIHLAIAKLRAGAPSWVTFTFNGTRFDLANDGPNEQDAQDIVQKRVDVEF